MSEKLDLEAIEARERRATPGPWEERDNRDEGHGVSTIDPRGRGDDIVCLGSDGLSADLAFIAHARTDMFALCAEVRRLREVAEAWRALANARLEQIESIEPRNRVAAGMLGREARARLVELGLNPDGKEAW